MRKSQENHSHEKVLSGVYAFFFSFSIYIKYKSKPPKGDDIKQCVINTVQNSEGGLFCLY